MTTLSGCNHRFALHGLIVDLLCEVPAMNRSIDCMVGEFSVEDWPEGFKPTTGVIRPYDAEVVMRHLSPKARALGEAESLRDIYQEGTCFWLIDDRWGIVELDLLKNHFQAWVLPEARVDWHSIVQDAVMWPLAQLLRGKGLHLLPAVSVARDGWGTLMISQVNVEGELDALIHSGFQVIGQQWTALRMDDERIGILHVPGMVEHAQSSQVRTGMKMDHSRQWIDVTRRREGSQRNHAYCDAVMIIEPGRRAQTSIRPVDKANAAALLRERWPIVELYTQRRGSSMAGRLASDCKIFSVTLSRNAEDLIRQMDLLHHARGFQGNPSRVEVQVHSGTRRRVPA